LNTSDVAEDTTLATVVPVDAVALLNVTTHGLVAVGVLPTAFTRLIVRLFPETEAAREQFCIVRPFKFA
jgi:hypothetical protein